jgi:hypothetical protein
VIPSSEIITICNAVILDYHQQKELETALPNLEPTPTLAQLIEQKSRVDTIQWHLEDEVRNPYITAEDGWSFKKKIDIYNQKRTHLVEEMDVLFFEHFQNVKTQGIARFNSETPGWIIDRLSILGLKIFHMQEQTERLDTNEAHLKQCQLNLSILKGQQADLCCAFDQLISDLAKGAKYMKRYLQIKMYNDEQLNPVLYQSAHLKKQ